jgi:hypothetical protein
MALQTLLNDFFFPETGKGQELRSKYFSRAQRFDFIVDKVTEHKIYTLIYNNLHYMQFILQQYTA